MRKNIKEQKYDFSNVEGISQKQLAEHYKLYQGYVSKINEIWSILDQKLNFENPNSTYSSIRSLKLGETYALDGVKLHQLYFENLGGNEGNCSGKILKLIERDYFSCEYFYERFRDIGLAMRGWAVLAIDPIDNRLHIYGLDAHDVGPVWNAYPLLVLDVYEHAYFLDFGTNRKAYINTFIRNINWRVVNKRLNEYLTLKNNMTL